MDIFWEMFRLFSCEIYFKIALTTCKRYYFFNEQNTYCFDRAAQGHLPKKTHASKVVLENFTKSFFVSQSYLLLISIGFLFISAFFDILASLSISRIFSRGFSGRPISSCLDIPRTIIKCDYINYVWCVRNFPIKL